MNFNIIFIIMFITIQDNDYILVSQFKQNYPYIVEIQDSYFDYNLVNEVQSYDLINIDSIDEFQKINSNIDTYNYIYFGRPTCPTCEKFMPVLETVISENKINVYYFNTD